MQLHGMSAVEWKEPMNRGMRGWMKGEKMRPMNTEYSNNAIKIRKFHFTIMRFIVSVRMTIIVVFRLDVLSYPCISATKMCFWSRIISPYFALHTKKFTR